MIDLRPSAAVASSGIARSALALEEHTARDFDPLSREPAVLLGEQASDHRPDVVRHADAAHSRDRRDKLVELGVVAHRAATEIGFDRAGRYHIGGYATRAELPGEITGENLDGAFIAA